MMSTLEENEALLMHHLQRVHPVILDQIIEDIPQLSWNQIFETVDALSRRGVISLRRRGYEYEVSPIPQNLLT